MSLSYFPDVYEEMKIFINKRHHEYYQLGDKVVIASFKEIALVQNIEIHYNDIPQFGITRTIQKIECNSIDFPRNIDFQSQVYITVMFSGDEEDHIPPHAICVPHTDIINETVLVADVT